MGLSRPNAPSQAAEPAPPSEMDMIKQRLGFSGNVNRDSSNNVAARNAFLSHGSSGFGMQDYVPEGDFRPVGDERFADANGNEPSGDYLAIMARDGQNDAIRAANQGIVSRAQENDAIRQAEIQNALKQDAAYQKMEIEAREAEMQDEFFRANGIIPSPQAMAEFQKQLGRQKATSQFVEALSGLAAKKNAKYKQLFAGYENIPEDQLPPAILRAKAQIDSEFDRQEQMIGMASGLQSGINNPSNMVPKDGPGLQ